MKKSSPNPRSNRYILSVTYGISILFVCMLVYFGFFIQVKSQTIINNPYNARLDTFANRIVRGQILSSDRSVLARTDVAEDGTETRVYPYGGLFAHPVGYTAKGKTGLESLANFYLLSSHVNLGEQLVNELSGIKNIGDNIVTTLDVNLQQLAESAMGGRNGAVVAMEPDTGKVLALYSSPGFDPNTLTDQWESLVSPDNTRAQLLNRGTQGLYPPGSTFKIVTLMEYIREHPDTYQDYVFDCNGIYEYEDYKIKCYRETAHGRQNLEQAFANSCNGAFASMGLSLDLDQMYALSEQLLFNKELPLSVAYNKSSYQMKARADTWEILQTSIGQGTTQISPMHNAMIAAAIANGGTLMKPYFIDHVENAAGETVQKFMPESYGPLLNAKESEIMAQMMKSVVDVGTGSALRTDAYTVAGKTGSAEFETGKESHGWFTGFAPAQDPQLVVCVIVEEGGTGGKSAAPIARKLFDGYFGK